MGESTKSLYQARGGKRVFLTVHERVVAKDGHEFPYFFVTRGKDAPPHSEKKPDAVVIVAFLPEIREAFESRRLVLTSEYRIPIGTRELGLPAGLIDAADYEGGASIAEAATNAAIRELKEETGFDFHPTEVSPDNLYSSAGLTNESVVFVFGTATGEASTEGNEAMEDIEVLPATHGWLVDLMRNGLPEDVAWSKTSWPLFWAFEKMGEFPDL